MGLLRRGLPSRLSWHILVGHGVTLLIIFSKEGEKTPMGLNIGGGIWEWACSAVGWPLGSQQAASRIRTVIESSLCMSHMTFRPSLYVQLEGTKYLPVEGCVLQR